MTYSVQNTDGSRTINVAASQVNSSFSVALVGRNVSGYGQYFVQNSIRHLENFASSSAPADDILLTGQAWYDKNEDVMRVYDGSGWQRMSITVSAAAPSGGVNSGTAYYDTKDDKLKVHNGTAFVDASYAGKVTNQFSGISDVGSPSLYGTRIRTMYVPGNDGIKRAVLALMYVNNGTNSFQGATSGESVMAIFSDHAEFTIDTTATWEIEGLADVSLYTEFTDSDGIGNKIKPGMNLRQKYSGTAIALANVALEANIANAIQTGSGNIDANNIIHVGRSYVPTTTDNETLGAAGSRFSELHIDTIFVGDPASSSAQYIKKAKTGGNTSVVLDIGESDAPIDNLYVTNVTLANGGGISGLNVESFGSNVAPIDEVWSSNVIVNEGNVWVNNLGFYGDLRNPVTGNIVVDVSGDAVITTTGTATMTNKTFGSDILATDNSVNIGNTGTKFGTVHSSTFNGVDAVLSGQANATTFNGNVSGASATLSGTVSGGTLTDGTLSSTAGTITGGVAATFSGNVTGNYFVGTATAAQYADLAEVYSADSDYEAGTVVKIGGDAEVTQTESHADVDVFGVVSSTPAYLMNSEAEGLPIALAGRVPVKVIGKVAKGERLVSSDVPGVAWALGEDEYDARAIIGRALQSKEDGDAGIIEAVIGVK
tara:strand:+ start:513 stop:2477 length:1965 start_codon:yes stop_codon:yes gene_type:complete